MLKHSNKIFTDEIREVFGSQILPQYLTRIQFDYNKEVVCRVIESLEELLP